MPDVRGKLEGLGLQLVGNTPAEFADVVQDGDADVGQGHQGRRHQDASITGDEPREETMNPIRAWLALAAAADRGARRRAEPISRQAGALHRRLHRRQRDRHHRAAVRAEIRRGLERAGDGRERARRGRQRRRRPRGEIRAGRHHVLLGRQRRADHQPDAAAATRPTTWCAISRRSRGCWSCRASSRSTTTCRRRALRELIALAKAQPGKLSYASPGVGTPQHIAGELLKSLAGVDIVHVPYRGAVFTDVIGGRVTMTLQNMGAILPVVQAGPAARRWRSPR